MSQVPAIISPVLNCEFLILSAGLFRLHPRDFAEYGGQSLSKLFGANDAEQTTVHGFDYTFNVIRWHGGRQRLCDAIESTVGASLRYKGTIAKVKEPPVRIPGKPTGFRF